MAKTKRKARGTARIDTVPLPEMPKSLNLMIPPAIAKEFGNDFRVVAKYPWPIGIPVPYRYIDKALTAKLGKNLGVFIAPL